MKFSVENMNEISASEILRWQYEEPYDFYNNEHDAEGIKELFENNYSVVLNQNRELLAFFVLALPLKCLRCEGWCVYRRHH